MKPTQVISELTYSCYKFNRETFPETTSEQWAAIFGSKTEALEQRFQSEQPKELDREPAPVNGEPYEVYIDRLYRDGAHQNGLERMVGLLRSIV